jgi:YD repeat-containing protein
MSDRDRWELRGPVRIVEITRTWQQNGDHSIVEFRPDGAISRHWHRNPDNSEFTAVRIYDDAGRLISVEEQSASGSRHLNRNEYDDRGRLARILAPDIEGNQRIRETYSYDAEGRKTKTYFVDLAAQRPNTNYSWGVEGSEASYSAPNAATITTSYDQAGRPMELLFRDAPGALVSRVACVYDESGNLTEEVQTLLVSPFPEFEAQLPPDQLAALRGVVSGPFARRVHRYDALGRRIETLSSLFGLIGKSRETLAYNEYGDPVAQTSEEESREYGFSDEGQLDSRPGSRSRSEARFLYEYDARGNWTSKVVEAGHGDNPDFSVTSSEHRALTYFDPI